jgi:hypothetical protein
MCAVPRLWREWEVQDSDWHHEYRCIVGSNLTPLTESVWHWYRPTGDGLPSLPSCCSTLNSLKQQTVDVERTVAISYARTCPSWLPVTTYWPSLEASLNIIGSCTQVRVEKHALVCCAYTSKCAQGRHCTDIKALHSSVNFKDVGANDDLVCLPASRQDVVAAMRCRPKQGEPTHQT